jgi:hypothetical protein
MFLGTQAANTSVSSENTQAVIMYFFAISTWLHKLIYCGVYRKVLMNQWFVLFAIEQLLASSNKKNMTVLCD